ncbi:MAG: hypothetical protein ACP5OG_03510 [Candidatus Nanoarchaeia archaeon]
MKNKNKRGQITVFIILALILAIAVVVYFLYRSISSSSSFESPIKQIQSCSNKYTQEAIDILSRQGGKIDPQLFYLYDENKVGYTCYTEEYYKTCVMQTAFLKQSIEKEIETYLKPRVSECIQSAKESLEKKGYEVSFKEVEPKVELIPTKVKIELKTKMTVKRESQEYYESIKSQIDSNLYELTMIASSISNWEARYGTSETTNYMAYYPNMRVEKKEQSNGTTIYIITERNDLDKFMFASKSLVWPVGI